MSEWEIVTTVGTDEEAALVAGYLEAAGFPVAVESLLFHQEPVNFGRLGEVRVKVPAGHLAAAREALAGADDAAAGDAAADDEPPAE